MGIIRLLDEHLANQIAAGEVVERPASVVKELIENAVDAGATRIDISAEEGGLALLRVADNGAGIAPDDLPLAFQRHATSKIAAGKDLFQIATLGFRGEALPSIAAVAKVTCLTAADGSGLGRRLEIEGGAVKRHEDAAAPQGTDITVRELFYNTPARLKYMKTVQTELGHLSDAVYRQALARPDIAFTFRHNGNVLLRTPGNGDLRQVVAAIYGTAAAKAMVEIAAEHPDYSLSGLTAMPVETRSNRSAVTVLVNGRYVRSQSVVQPLLQAYHTLLPVGRYPLSVLHLRMHPSLVDVNVHPSKLEVRFSKENELRAFVESAVREALGRHAYIPSGAAAKPAKAPPSFVQDRIRFRLPPDEAAGASAPAGPANGSGFAASAQASAPTGFGRSADPDEAAGSGRPAADRERAPFAPFRDTAREAPAPYAARPSAARASDRLPEEMWQAVYGQPERPPEPPAFPELQWVGQVHGTYIVAQNEDGLYLIDQHAAHERIHYEQFYEKFGSPAQASQDLLLPVTLEFAPDESEALRQRLGLLEQVGVYLDDFGGNTFIVRSVPYWFPKGDEADVVREMAEWVLSERGVDLRKLREKAAILCSCKASIKANDALTREAGERLLKRLAACRQPYTCPHGRPIVVSFSTYELEKLFKRVMP